MRGYYGYGFPGGAGYAGVAGFPWVSLLMWVVGIAVVAAVIYFAIKAGRGTVSGNALSEPKREAALDILAERFAKGEISKDEYVEAKDFLKKN